MSFNPFTSSIDRNSYKDSLDAYNKTFLTDDEEPVAIHTHVIQNNMWTGVCSACRAQRLKRIEAENWTAVATTIAIGLCSWAVLSLTKNQK